MSPRSLLTAATFGIAILGVAIGLGGCSSKGRAVRVSAGGATFPDPLVQKWSAEYRQLKGAEIDYVKKGSGFGIEQMTNRNFDFGGTDAPMSAKELKAAQQEGGDVIHVPMTMGAVAVIYNLPELQGQLKLSGPVLADIYLRKATRWNDPAVAALNPGAALPDKEITAVRRAESSGTTNIFTEYLAKAGPAFPKEMVSKNPRWPEGTLGQEGSDGVTSHVARNPYSLGYVEVLYAKKNSVPVALLRNKAGEFVGPDADRVTAAAAEAIKEKPTAEPYSLHPLTFSLTDAAGKDAYPIAGASYAMLYRRQPRGKGEVVVDFLKWAVSDGQRFAKDLEYAPLPAELTARATAELGTVTFE